MGSIFTNPPPPAPPKDPPLSPLDDYTLASLCKIKGGWHVILLNKKNREERVRLRPNESNKLGFRVVSVEHPTSHRDATVEIEIGTVRAIVKFESKFLQPHGPAVQAGMGQGKRTNLHPQPPLPRGKVPHVNKLPTPVIKK
jgi:hypothetical protein